MRFLLSTLGSRGDVEPMAALAARLRELGAEVVVASPPDLAEVVRRAGVEHLPVGRPVREFVRMATRAQRPSISELAGEILAAHHPALAEAARGCDAVVATGLMPGVLAARVAAEQLGIRYEHVSFQQVSLPSPYRRPFAYPGHAFPPEVTDNRALWDLDVVQLDAVFGVPYNAFRAWIGLPPVENVRRHAFTDHPWLAVDPLLGPWLTPAELEPVLTGAWILPDHRPLPGDLAAFLDAGDPPVYVGFGSMPMAAAPDAAAVAIAAVRGHGRRVVVQHGWAGLELVDDRDDCIAVGEVNQQALFRRVAAVVHHGGSGTTHAAARAGAPQVVVPQVVDQPYWGARVAELGIGAVLDGPAPAAEPLSRALGAALDPGTARRAAEVAGEIRTDGTTVAARLLLAGGDA